MDVWVGGWVGEWTEGGQIDGQTDGHTGRWKDGWGWMVGTQFSGLQYRSGRPVSTFNRMITELIPRNVLLPQVGPWSPVIAHVRFSDGALL